MLSLPGINAALMDLSYFLEEWVFIKKLSGFLSHTVTSSKYVPSIVMPSAIRPLSELNRSWCRAAEPPKL
jgi:hypothetical protein